MATRTPKKAAAKITTAKAQEAVDQKKPEPQGEAPNVKEDKPGILIQSGSASQDNKLLEASVSNEAQDKDKGEGEGGYHSDASVPRIGDVQSDEEPFDIGNLILVKYVGRKLSKQDNVAGTQLVWTQGQIHALPPLVASKLLRFADVWQEATTEEFERDPSALGIIVTSADIVPTKRTELDKKAKAVNLPPLQQMSKAELGAYAQTQFGITLDAKLAENEMIQQIISLQNSNHAGE